MSIVNRLAQAIAKEEGFWSKADTLPKRLNNPGDLNFAGQIGATAHAVPGRSIPYAQFATLGHGVVALYRQLWLDIAKEMTLKDLITSYAPAADGNPTQSYLENVKEWTGIVDEDRKLIDLIMLEWQES